MPPRSSQGGTRTPVKPTNPASTRMNSPIPSGGSSKKKAAPKKKAKQIEEEEETLRLQQEQREQEQRQAQFDAYIAEEQKRRVDEFDQRLSHNYVPSHDVSLFQNIFTRTFKETISRPIVPPLLPAISRPVPDNEAPPLPLADAKPLKPRSGAGKSRRVSSGKGDSLGKGEGSVLGKMDANNKLPELVSPATTANPGTHGAKMGNTSKNSSLPISSSNSQSNIATTSLSPDQTPTTPVTATQSSSSTLPGTLLPRQSLPLSTLTALTDIERQYQQNQFRVNSIYENLTPHLSINGHVRSNTHSHNNNITPGGNGSNMNNAYTGGHDADDANMDAHVITSTNATAGTCMSPLSAFTDIDREYANTVRLLQHRNHAQGVQDAVYGDTNTTQRLGTTIQHPVDAKQRPRATTQRDSTLRKTKPSILTSTSTSHPQSSCITPTSTSTSRISATHVSSANHYRPSTAQLPPERRHLQYALEVMRYSQTGMRTRNHASKRTPGTSRFSESGKMVIFGEKSEETSPLHISPSFLTFYPSPSSPSHTLCITIANHDTVSHRISLLPCDKHYISASLSMKSGHIHVHNHDSSGKRTKLGKNAFSQGDGVGMGIQEGDKYNAVNTTMTVYGKPNFGTETGTLPGVTVPTTGGSLAPGMSATMTICCEYELTSTLHTSITIRTDIGNFEIPIFICPPIPNLAGIPTIWKIPASSPNAISESVLGVEDSNQKRQYNGNNNEADRENISSRSGNYDNPDETENSRKHIDIPKKGNRFYIIPAYKVLLEDMSRRQDVQSGRHDNKNDDNDHSDDNNDEVHVKQQCIKITKGDVKTGFYDPLYTADDNNDDHDDHFYKLSPQLRDKTDEEIALFMNNPSLCLLATQFNVNTILDLYYLASKRHYYENGEYNIHDFDKYIAKLQADCGLASNVHDNNITKTNTNTSATSSSTSAMHCVTVPVTTPEILITGVLDDNNDNCYKNHDDNDHHTSQLSPSTSTSYIPARAPAAEPHSYALTLAPTVFTLPSDHAHANATLRNDQASTDTSRPPLHSSLSELTLTSQFAATMPVSLQSLFVLFSSSGNFMIFSVAAHCSQPILSLLRVNETVFTVPTREMTTSSSENPGKNLFSGKGETPHLDGIPLPLLHAEELPSITDAVIIDDIPYLTHTTSSSSSSSSASAGGEGQRVDANSRVSTSNGMRNGNANAQGDGHGRSDASAHGSVNGVEYGGEAVSELPSTATISRNGTSKSRTSTLSQPEKRNPTKTTNAGLGKAESSRKTRFSGKNNSPSPSSSASASPPLTPSSVDSSACPALSTPTLPPLNTENTHTPSPSSPASPLSPSSLAFVNHVLHNNSQNSIYSSQKALPTSTTSTIPLYEQMLTTKTRAHALTNNTSIPFRLQMDDACYVLAPTEYGAGGAHGEAEAKEGSEGKGDNGKGNSMDAQSVYGIAVDAVAHDTSCSTNSTATVTLKNNSAVAVTLHAHTHTFPPTHTSTSTSTSIDASHTTEPAPCFFTISPTHATLPAFTTATFTITFQPQIHTHVPNVCNTDFAMQYNQQKSWNQENNSDSSGFSGFYEEMVHSYASLVTFTVANMPRTRYEYLPAGAGANQHRSSGSGGRYIVVSEDDGYEPLYSTHNNHTGDPEKQSGKTENVFFRMLVSANALLSPPSLLPSASSPSSSSSSSLLLTPSPSLTTQTTHTTFAIRNPSTFPYLLSLSTLWKALAVPLPYDVKKIVPRDMYCCCRVRECVISDDGSARVSASGGDNGNSSGGDDGADVLDTRSSSLCTCVPTWLSILDITLTPTSLVPLTSTLVHALSLPSISLSSFASSSSPSTLNIPSVHLPARTTTAFALALLSRVPLALTPPMLTLPLALAPTLPSSPSSSSSLPAPLTESLTESLATTLSLACVWDVASPTLALPFSSSHVSSLTIFPKPDNSLILIPNELIPENGKFLDSQPFFPLPCGWVLHNNATLTKIITIHNTHNIDTPFHLFVCTPSLTQNAPLIPDLSSPLSFFPDSGTIPPNSSIDIQLKLSYTDMLTMQTQKHVYYMVLKSGMGTLPAIAKINVVFHVMNIDIYPKKITYDNTSSSSVISTKSKKKMTSIAFSPLSVGATETHDINFYVPQRVDNFYQSCRRDMIVDVAITNIPHAHTQPSASSVSGAPGVAVNTPDTYTFTNGAVSITLPSRIPLHAHAHAHDARDTYKTPLVPSSASSPSPLPVETVTPRHVASYLRIHAHAPGPFACLITYNLRESSLSIPIMITGIVSPLQWNIGIVSPYIIQKLCYLTPLYQLLTYIKHNTQDTLLQELQNTTQIRKNRQHNGNENYNLLPAEKNTNGNMSQENADNGDVPISGNSINSEERRMRRSSMVIFPDTSINLQEEEEGANASGGSGTGMDTTSTTSTSLSHNSYPTTTTNSAVTNAHPISSLLVSAPLTHAEIRKLLTSEFSNRGKNDGNSRWSFSQLSDCFRWTSAWGPQIYGTPATHAPTSQFSDLHSSPSSSSSSPRLHISAAAGGVSVGCLVLRNDSDAHVNILVKVLPATSTTTRTDAQMHGEPRAQLGAEIKASEHGYGSEAEWEEALGHQQYTTAHSIPTTTTGTYTAGVGVSASAVGIATSCEPRLKLPDVFRKHNNTHNKTRHVITSGSDYGSGTGSGRVLSGRTGKPSLHGTNTLAHTQTATPAVLPPLSTHIQTSSPHTAHTRKVVRPTHSHYTTNAAKLSNGGLGGRGVYSNGDGVVEGNGNGAGGKGGKSTGMHVNGRHYMDGKGYQSIAGQQYVQMESLRRQRQLSTQVLTVWPHVMVIPQEVYSLWTTITTTDDEDTNKLKKNHYDNVHEHVDNLLSSQDNIPLADALLALQQQQPIVTVPAHSIVCVRVFAAGANQGEYDTCVKITYLPANADGTPAQPSSSSPCASPVSPPPATALIIPVHVSVQGSPITTLPVGNMKKSKIPEIFRISGKPFFPSSKFRTGIGRISLASHVSQLSHPIHTYTTTQHLPTLPPFSSSFSSSLPSLASRHHHTQLYPYPASAPPGTHAYLTHMHSLSLSASLHPFQHLLSSSSSTHRDKLSTNDDKLSTSFLTTLSLLQSLLSVQTHAFHVTHANAAANANANARANIGAAGTGLAAGMRGPTSASVWTASMHRSGNANTASHSPHSFFPHATPSTSSTSCFVPATPHGPAHLCICPSLPPLSSSAWLQYIQTIFTLMQGSGMAHEQHHEDNITYNNDKLTYNNSKIMPQSPLMVDFTDISSISVAYLKSLLPTWAYTPYYLPMSSLLRQRRQSGQDGYSKTTISNPNTNTNTIQTRLRLFNKSSRQQDITLFPLAMKTMHPDELVKTVVHIVASPLDDNNDDAPLVSLSITALDVVDHMHTHTRAHYSHLLRISPSTLSLAPGQATAVTLTVDAEAGYELDVGAMLVACEVEGVVSCCSVLVWDERNEDEE